jgi:hypothetical protein
MGYPAKTLQEYLLRELEALILRKTRVCGKTGETDERF